VKRMPPRASISPRTSTLATSTPALPVPRIRPRRRRNYAPIV